MTSWCAIWPPGPGAGDLRLVGEGGSLAWLAKTVIEAGPEGEMDGHLGYAKHDPAGSRCRAGPAAA